MRRGQNRVPEGIGVKANPFRGGERQILAFASCGLDHEHMMARRDDPKAG